ncbi:Protein of unknown function [Gryllus bimaculatus]|nr:Protein of unknown function [Gryllus bimaculatus]
MASDPPEDKSKQKNTKEVSKPDATLNVKKNAKICYCYFLCVPNVNAETAPAYAEFRRPEQQARANPNTVVYLTMALSNFPLRRQTPEGRAVQQGSDPCNDFKARVQALRVSDNFRESLKRHTCISLTTTTKQLRPSYGLQGFSKFVGFNNHTSVQLPVPMTMVANMVERGGAGLARAAQARQGDVRRCMRKCSRVSASSVCVSANRTRLYLQH